MKENFSINLYYKLTQFHLNLINDSSFDHLNNKKINNLAVYK